MSEALFAETLCRLMHRPRYTATAGLASKLSGVPRATIVNWLEGRVSRPRCDEDLLKLADALRFDKAETAELFAAAGRQRADRSDPLHAPTASRLPVQITQLIGREAEVDAICGAVQDPALRLITLIGPGGVGKTHLAIAVGSRLRSAFPDGLFWLSLANLRNPAQVLPDLAQALGIHVSPSQSLSASVHALLGTARVLLVIDNFEHLMPAAVLLNDILESTEHTKCLVTSRTPLRLRGEHEVRVDPLAFPETNPLPALTELIEFPAISLFVARARDVCSNFAISPENAADVAAICKRVDGLPLALELAAAQARALKPRTIRQRLSRPLHVLIDGARNAASRQQTLRETIAWSYALLSDEHRSLFRRLAVFAGGISNDAAAAVCGITSDEGRELVLDRLRDLVEHSLITPAFDGPGEPRFRMLTTIREFAEEQLCLEQEEYPTRQLQCAFVLSLAEHAEQLFSREPTAVWSGRLRIEHDNLRAVLSWCIEGCADPRGGARLVAALGRYWFEHGLFLESRYWLERVVSSDTPCDSATDAKLKLYLAFVANYDGDYLTGATWARAALVAYRHADDSAGEAQARNAIGIAAMYSGDYACAEEHFDAALAAYEKLGDRRGVAVALHNLGEIASECRSDFAAARVLFERSLDMFTGLGHTLNVGMTLGVVAECHANAGDDDAAVAASEAALSAFRTLGNEPLMVEEFIRLARFAVTRGELGRCRSLLVEAIERLRATVNPRHHARCFEGFASLADALGRPQEAALLVALAERIRTEHAIPMLPASARRHRQWIAGLRDRLGSSSYEIATASGAKLDITAAIAQALRAVSVADEVNFQRSGSRQRTRDQKTGGQPAPAAGAS